jgi:Tol biopolymer transport system component
MDGTSSKEIYKASSKNGIKDPFWSPDSSRIVFTSKIASGKTVNYEMDTISSTGGSTTTLLSGLTSTGHTLGWQ